MVTDWESKSTKTVSTSIEFCNHISISVRSVPIHRPFLYDSLSRSPRRMGAFDAFRGSDDQQLDNHQIGLFGSQSVRSAIASAYSAAIESTLEYASTSSS